MNGKLEDTAIQMVVDTGSSITVVHPRVIQELGMTENVCNSALQYLKTVTGQRIPISGTIRLKLGVGDEEMFQEFWVAEIAEKIVLGLDFLKAHECNIDVSARVLIMNGNRVPLMNTTNERDNNTYRCYRITAAADCKIPPRSEALIPGETMGFNGNDTLAIIEPSKKVGRGIMVGKVLTGIKKNCSVPVRIMNLSDKPYHVKKGTPIANCEIIDDTRNISKSDASEVHLLSSDEQNLPEAVQDLYERSEKNLNSGQKKELYNLLHRNVDVFSTGPDDLGQINKVQHRIETGEAVPIKQAARRLPRVKQEEARKIVNKMEEQGIIEPSQSPWSSPVVLVRKKDGSTRFCVDYRRLNDVTRKDSYPLPRIDDTIDNLAGSKWFSTLDLRSGYWQIRMDPRHKEKTAFTTGRGLWQFRVMPFGLCNAPATFERLMDHVLAGLPWDVCAVYLDDIIVLGPTFEKKIENLEEVFNRLRAANLKLSPKKCELFQVEVVYLGHIITADGIRTDPAKIETVLSWPQPKNVAELRRFLGFCSYYRRFVNKFTEISEPLFRLTRKNQPFEWNIEAEEAFQNLKQALTSQPVLAFPSENGQFILDTDASAVGIGAVLSQRVEGEEKVLAYYSRSLNKAERRYCVTRRELLAVVKSIEHFHPYLYGQCFLVRTDHAALRWLMSFKSPEGQIARWIQKLQQYHFTVEHRSGQKHVNADALSRRPCVNQNCKKCERLKLRDQALAQVESENCHCNGEEPRVDLVTAEERESWSVIVESKDELRSKQEEDPDLKVLIDLLEVSGERPDWSNVAPGSEKMKVLWAQWESLIIEDGLLYRKFESVDGRETKLQLIVPESLQEEVLKYVHDNITSGHLGINKTLSRLRERFYWPDCGRAVRNYCRKCDMCAAQKGPKRKDRAPLGRYVVGCPLERVAIDVTGPFVQSYQGNRYLLVVMDYYTKWPEAYPLPNQEATTVARTIVNEFVCRYGVPLELHSDQGRNFESAVFREMCCLLGIKKTRTSPRHPESDGMVERYNRTLKQQLSLFVEEQQKDWDIQVPMLLLAYRTANHESTKFTPAKLMLGHELRVPVDLAFGRPEPTLSVTNFAQKIQKDLEKVNSFARKNLRISVDRMKRQYDTNPVPTQFSAGDLVWYYYPKRKKGLSPKLRSNWEGPYVVVKRLNDLIYRIKLSSRAKPKVVHRNHLWKYGGSKKAEWYNQGKEQNRNEASITGSETVTGEGSGQLRRSERRRKPVERFGL